MKIAGFAIRSINNVVSQRCNRSVIARTLSTGVNPGSMSNGRQNSNAFQPGDDFEKRIFGDVSSNNSQYNSFYQKLDRLEKSGGRGGNFGGPGGSEVLDGIDESFNTLADGMDGKLEKAAKYFDYDSEEVEQDGYAFRPDVTFMKGMTYDIKDLDLRKPGVQKSFKRPGFEVTTEEVLRKADFRNVRFLANFITDAGILIKRSQTRISAKAQRKVAREIKTARAFGLMPFTTMGKKSFVYGRTMEDLDTDFEYESFSRAGDTKDSFS